MNNTFNPFHEEDEDVLVMEKTEKTKSIVVYNDDYNTFDHVINCFINYCKHSTIQAEQCANIIHNNGKCSVKNGNFDKLKPIKEALCEAGLSATIE
jgi:ATP-dependent Clp protease adaptor protein ClpS